MEQAGQNAIAATASQPQPDLNLEYNDWTDTNSEDKEQPTFTVSSNSSSTSLPFTHSETSSEPSLVSVTTSSTNYINQNTQPYTTNHQDQKPLWSPDVGDAAISSLMLSPSLITNSVAPAALQVQNCSLPSTTLDLSDIKWGILDQEPVKRETSVSVDKQLTIQNIQ